MLIWALVLDTVHVIIITVVMIGITSLYTTQKEISHKLLSEYKFVKMAVLCPKDLIKLEHMDATGNWLHIKITIVELIWHPWFNLILC